MPEKKNQHFVPAFYLRMFSIKDRKDSIRLFNIETKKFIPYAKISKQASKPYYYGSDLRVENWLGKNETIFGRLIKKFGRGEMIDRFNAQTSIFKNSTYTLTEEFTSLLYFITVTDFRNPIRKKQMEGMYDKYTIKFKDNKKFLEQINQAKEHSTVFPLFFVERITQLMADLHYKIIINNTAIPFITSDYPVAIYNQWMVSRLKRNGGGYGSIGFQCFVPISDRCCIVVYDVDAYNVGKLDQSVFYLGVQSDVNKLNLLQYLNSYANMYGNERMEEGYILKLGERAKRFSRQHQKTNELSSFEFDESKVTIEMSEGTDFNLDLSFVKLTEYGKRSMVNSKLGSYRPYVKEILARRKREGNQ